MTFASSAFSSVSYVANSKSELSDVLMLVLLSTVGTFSGHQFDHAFLKMTKSSLDLNSIFTSLPYAMSNSLGLSALSIYFFCRFFCVKSIPLVPPDLKNYLMPSTLAL